MSERDPMVDKGKYSHVVQRVTELPDGGSVTVTISSSEPIDESEYLILNPNAVKEMAECMVNLANAFRPPDSPEIVISERINAQGGPNAAE